MSVSYPISDERMGQIFKALNRFMLLLWRLGLGFWFQWPKAFGCIMVIIHRGRKTGLHHRTPVNFAIHDGDIYCTAAFGSQSDWYRNILEDPQVEVWLHDGWWAGYAEDATESERGTEILRKVLIASGFAASAFGLNPYGMSEDDLATLLNKYRLVRIQRVEARTGPGGPGDLAWIWQVLSFILLPLMLILLKGKKKK